MKAHLFYTFLAIFIITATVTIGGLIGFFNIDNSILRILVVGLLVELGTALFGLFKRTEFFEQESSPTLATSPTSELVTANAIVAPLTSDSTKDSEEEENELEIDIATLKPFEEFEDFRNMLQALDHRFHEKSEFSQKAIGAKISWSGFMDSVVDIDWVPGGIQVHISSSTHYSSDVFCVEFPPPLRTKVYSLQKSDFVRVIGTIRTAYPMLYVDGDSIELLNT